MTDPEFSASGTPSHPRTVQDYIDMCPTWPDGTPTGSAPMTAMQSLIWSLAAAGKFFEGLVVFMTGIALPLIARQFHITAGQDGIVSAAKLRLDGPTLAAIYAGKVRTWDDAAIVAMNAGLKLPHAAIVPIHRSDSSGRRCRVGRPHAARRTSESGLCSGRQLVSVGKLRIRDRRCEAAKSGNRRGASRLSPVGDRSR